MPTDVPLRSTSGAAVTGAAATMTAAEEARRLRRDATAVVERMALEGRRAGLVHPVAAAVALAVRVSALAGPEAFAERLGIPLSRLVEAESGTVRFGDLPIVYDRPCGELGLDLLCLADLERRWRTDADRPDASGQG